MSNSASHLAREAKGLHQGLKELLKTHNPWDKEVEFSRKNLRRQYLRLLLVEPYAIQSKDAETHLWMQTSYQFISRYKQNLASLERTIQSAPRQQARQGGHGPVEYRKLMQRFRQFLSDEEKFWTQFVVRYQRSFALHQAKPALIALTILPPSDDAHLANLPDSDDRNATSNQNNGRNHFSFPPEESTPPPDPAEHESRLAILNKAIVCLGDIARYRELYNEAGGRPKAGHEDGVVPAKRGGRGRRGGIPGFDAIPRARNYDKAIQCYEQARLLVPYEGNSSHQLAILAFYQGDMFGSLFHYYRALCVRQPYDTASENVKIILKKALDQHIKKTRDAPQIAIQESGDVPPRLRVEYLKENVVLLHALWRLGSDKAHINPVKHADDVAKDFQSLVSERILPIETVSKVVVLSQSALWKHQMIRDTSPPSNRGSSGLPDSSFIESLILMHIIAIYRVLLEIGSAELAVPPEDAAENDLAQRITAPFRRTLPALRVASKWLLANIKYVLHASQSSVGEQTSPSDTRGVLIQGLSLFWAKFAQFYSTLNSVFPLDRLPCLTTPLDEDVDLKGFLPLRDLLVDGGQVAGNEAEQQQNGTVAHGREKVHPNEEQLMRIWDLLKDAKSLADLELCPIHLDGNTFSFDDSVTAVSAADVDTSGLQLADQVTPYAPKNAYRQHEEEDAMTDNTSRTDDDPVGDAFREALLDHVEDDEDDGEVILWNPRPLGSPPAPVHTALPATPILHTLGAPKVDDPTALTKATSATTPGRTAPRSPMIVHGTTAQDLLNNVLGTKRGPTDVLRAPRSPSIAGLQPSFPFGLGPNAPPSIWSTTHDSAPQLSSPPSMGLGYLQSSHSSLTGAAAFGSPGGGLSHVHRPSVPLSMNTPQAPYQAAYSRMTPSLTEPHRPSPWSSHAAPFVDPAIVSAAAAIGTSAYPGFSNGHGQPYVRPQSGPHHKSPSASRTWGAHGS